MVRKQFIDPMRAFRGGSIVDLDWLWDELALREPLDVERVVAHKTEFIVVATSSESGQPAYFQPDTSNMFEVLKGSCALPLLYRRTVRVAGAPVIDGGVADPLPVEEAHRRGARRILVVRSRPASYVKKTGMETRILSAVLGKAPRLLEAIRSAPERYRKAVEFIHSPPPGCAIVQLAPPEGLSSKRTTRDAEKLKRDYQLGRELAEDVIRGWQHAAAH